MNSGFCECGCGIATVISTKTDNKYGWVKGEPKRFVRGHATKGKKLEKSQYKDYNGWLANKAGYKKGHKGFPELNLVQYIRPYQSGEKHWNWKGGITPTQMKVRMSGKTKAWRDHIFERDNYTCQFCGSRGGYLEADHITPFRTLMQEVRGSNPVDVYEAAMEYGPLWDTDNGRTLCRPCHDKTKWRFDLEKSKKPAYLDK